MALQFPYFLREEGKQWDVVVRRSKTKSEYIINGKHRRKEHGV